MIVRSSSVILACAVLLSAASPALAQEDQSPDKPSGDKKKAMQIYNKGVVQYNLGRWQQAVELWEQAYEVFDAPEFLFNIGQAYRQQRNCERGLFFYRRYLATKPNAPNRSEVMKFIAELEKECSEKAGSGTGGGATAGGAGGTAGTGKTGSGDQSTGGATGQPGGDTTAGGEAGRDQRAVTGAGGAGDQSDVGAGDGSDAGGDGEADGEGDVEGGATPSPERPPHLFAVRIAGGPSFPSLGPLDVGTLVSFNLGAGHPINLGQIVLEPGALVTYTPVPWEVMATDKSGTAGLTGLLANVGVGYEFLPGLSGRAEAGVGALIFSGLTEQGNPFLDETDVADGAIPMFHVRGALGVEYAITKNIVVEAQPVVFSYSPSRPLRAEIDKITRFEMLIGAGYRM
ncbi:MAG TPA: tetratricopeptide repeat protein [Kofleriaceae bacterium]|nr:tetratricopeptide repeat protein [Kofleriaceae bacterium]